jgi:hypothetical protein
MSEHYSFEMKWTVTGTVKALSEEQAAEMVEMAIAHFTSRVAGVRLVDPGVELELKPLPAEEAQVVEAAEKAEEEEFSFCRNCDGPVEPDWPGAVMVEGFGLFCCNNCRIEFLSEQEFLASLPKPSGE